MVFACARSSHANVGGCFAFAGSWEHAGAKVFWDAHYQHALLLLSTAINWGKGAAPHARMTPVSAARAALPAISTRPL